MGTTLNVQLTDAQIEWLEHEAQRLGTSPSDVVACRIEEAQRESTFRNLEFRDTIIGREVYLRGTRLKVWHVMMYADDGNLDIAKFADDFKVRPEAVADALAYAQAYADEIEAIFAELDYISDNIEQLVPGIEVFRLDASHT